MKKGLVVLLVLFAAASWLWAEGQQDSGAASGKGVTLTYWMEMHSSQSRAVQNFGDLPIAKELEKRTGVHVIYQHPPARQALEAFNLMLASGDLTDIIEYNWKNAPGGPDASIDNGLIMDLSPYMADYAPNLLKYLKEHPDYDKDVKTDTGKYWLVPGLRANAKLVTTAGPIIRKDWLDDLGLQIPETPDEWYSVLKAFKDKKGASKGFTAKTYDQMIRTFASGFDAYLYDSGWYVDSGKVKFGYLDDNTKDCLAYVKKLIDDGLLDPDFLNTDTKTLDANMINGLSGAGYGSGGSGVGKWMAAAEKAGIAGYNLTGAPYSRVKRGVPSRYGSSSGVFSGQGSAAVNAGSKFSKEALKYLDYAYSPEGYKLVNFGVEGVSYNMVDGKPVFTDLIKHNPDGLSMPNAMAFYMRSQTIGPFAQDVGYIEQYYSMPQQQKAQDMWVDNNELKYKVPFLTPTVEETTEISKLQTDIGTYVAEMSLKFILGAESLDKWPEFQAQLKKLDIDRLIALKQAGYDRFLKR